MTENIAKQERYSEPEAQKEGFLIRDILDTGLTENHAEAQQLAEVYKGITKAVDYVATETGRRVGTLDYTSEEFWKSFVDITYTSFRRKGDSEQALPLLSKEIKVLENFGPNAGGYIQSIFCAEAENRYIHHIIEEAGILDPEEFITFKETAINPIFELSGSGGEISSPVVLRRQALIDSLRAKIGQEKIDRLEILRGLSEGSFHGFLTAGFPKLFNATELATFVDELKKSGETEYRFFIIDKLKRLGPRLEQNDNFDLFGSIVGHSKLAVLSSLLPAITERRLRSDQEGRIKKLNLDNIQRSREFKKKQKQND